MGEKKGECLDDAVSSFQNKKRGLEQMATLSYFLNDCSGNGVWGVELYFTAKSASKPLEWYE